MLMQKVPTESAYRTEMVRLSVAARVALQRHVVTNPYLGIPSTDRHKFRFAWDTDTRDAKEINDLTVYTPKELNPHQAEDMGNCIHSFVRGYLECQNEHQHTYRSEDLEHHLFQGVRGDMTTILEAARVALADSGWSTSLGDTLDLSEEEMLRISKKLYVTLNADTPNTRDEHLRE